MNLFRSEEHVARWLAGRKPGATIPVTQLAALADAWCGATASRPTGSPTPARRTRRSSNVSV